MHAERLDLSVGTPVSYVNYTKGLMGIYNGNVNDDLQPNILNSVPISSSSNESYIFNKFGETC